MNRINASGFDAGKIDFVGKFKFFFGVTIFLVIASLVLLFTKGLNYGIDFKGGTEVQVRFQQALKDDGQLRQFLKGLGIDNIHLQRFGDENEYLVRFDTLVGKDDSETNQLQKERIEKLTSGLQANFAQLNPEIRRVDSVGPQVGDQLKRNGLLAVFYSLIVILVYVGLRFDYNFAPGAVVCLFHDAIVVLGVFSLMDKEINVQILAAILTIIGYDINDTIIVFDRIRENLGIYKGVPTLDVINKSTNDTLSRTILTSTTTMFSCIALYVFAGGVISEFAFAMILGIILGTYSSIYVAAPLIVLFERFTKTKTA